MHRSLHRPIAQFRQWAREGDRAPLCASIGPANPALGADIAGAFAVELDLVGNKPNKSTKDSAQLAQW